MEVSAWQLGIMYVIFSTLLQACCQTMSLSLTPSGHAPCSIALALLDWSFEEVCHSHTIDLQVKSALPLIPLLLGVQLYLD